MNGFRLTVAIAAMISAGLARAGDGPGLTDPDYYPSTRPAYDSEDYVSLGSAPVPPPTVAPADAVAPVQDPPAAAEPACQCESCRGGCRSGCNPGKPWKIPQPCFLQQHGIQVGGWVQQGITLNSTDPTDGFNGPVATNDRAGEYQLNQLWLYLYRPVNTGGCGWDAGGRIDVIYGTDWRYGMSNGLESRFDDHDSFYGLVLPQFYGEVAYNDLSIRVGHFAAAFGYEQIPAPLNFFYSHSYTMNGYSEPILVTGMDAAYAVTDQFKVIGGFNRGWMQFEDSNESLDFLGGVKWISCDKKTDLSYMVTTGPQDPAGAQNVFAGALVVRRELSERLTYVIQNDIGTAENGNPRNPQDSAEWYSIIQYLFYKINPCWTAGMRFEWFRDEDGGRVAGVGNVIGTDKGWLGKPGFAGNFYELTAGVNWRPHPNFVFRPELRYDWYNGTTNVDGELPFAGGDRTGQLLFAMDMIFTY